MNIIIQSMDSLQRVPLNKLELKGLKKWKTNNDVFLYPKEIIFNDE